MSNSTPAAAAPAAVASLCHHACSGAGASASLKHLCVATMVGSVVGGLVLAALGAHIPCCFAQLCRRSACGGGCKTGACCSKAGAAACGKAGSSGCVCGKGDCSCKEGAAAACKVVGSGSGCSCGKAGCGCEGQQHKKVFVLLVSMKLDPAKGGVEVFKEAWAPLAADVKLREKNCLSYELCEGAEDKNSIIIYERYVARADLDGAHAEGLCFKAFGKRLGEGDLKGLVVERSKHFYVETNIGYMTK